MSQEQQPTQPSAPHFVTGLSDYAMAAGQANNDYTIATTPPEDILAMNDRAIKMRENFRSDATALANRGLIDSNRLTGFKGLVGYKNVAFELMGYAAWGALNVESVIQVSA